MVESCGSYLRNGVRVEGDVKCTDTEGFTFLAGWHVSKHWREFDVTMTPFGDSPNAKILSKDDASALTLNLGDFRDFGQSPLAK